MKAAHPVWSLLFALALAVTSMTVGCVSGSAPGEDGDANVMRDELMTPSITGFEQVVPMSAITIAAFEDMPYFDVSYDLADPFAVPSALAAPASNADAVEFNCELVRPQFEVDPSGRFFALEP